MFTVVVPVEQLRMEPGVPGRQHCSSSCSPLMGGGWQEHSIVVRLRTGDDCGKLGTSCCPDKSWFVIASTGLAKGSRSDQQARKFLYHCLWTEAEQWENSGSCLYYVIWAIFEISNTHNSRAVLKAIHLGMLSKHPSVAKYLISGLTLSWDHS